MTLGQGILIIFTFHNSRYHSIRYAIAVIVISYTFHNHVSNI